MNFFRKKLNKAWIKQPKVIRNIFSKILGINNKILISTLIVSTIIKPKTDVIPKITKPIMEKRTYATEYTQNQIIYDKEFKGTSLEKRLNQFETKFMGHTPVTFMSRIFNNFIYGVGYLTHSDKDWDLDINKYRDSHVMIIDI